MVHRTTLLRDVNAGQRDEQNNPVAPDYRPHAFDVPCYVYTPSRAQPGLSRQAAGREGLIVLYELEGLFPLDSGIKEGDQIEGLTTKGGQELSEDRCTVLRVMRHPLNLRAGMEVVR